MSIDNVVIPERTAPRIAGWRNGAGAAPAA